MTKSDIPLSQQSVALPPEVEELLEQARRGADTTKIIAAWPFPLDRVVAESVRQIAERDLDSAPRTAHALARLARALTRDVYEGYQRGHKARAIRGRGAATLAAAERRHANYEAAHTLLEEAVDLLRGYRNGPARRRANLEQAWLLFDLDRYQEAEEAFRSLLPALQQSQGAQRDLAACHRGLGQVLRARNQYQEAIQHAQLAIELLEQLGDDLEAARGRLDMAFHLLLQDSEQAISYVKAARAVFKKSGSAVDLAQADYYTGLITSEQTRYPQALPFFKKAHRVFVEEGLIMRAAQTEINHANTLYRMGRLEEALRRIQEAREKMVQAGRPVMTVACDANAGLMYAALGRYQQALVVFERALALCRERGLNVDAGRCLVNMAMVYEKTGQYARAMSDYQRASEIFRTADLAAYSAKCDQNMGTLYLTIGELDNALAHYGKAQEVYTDQQMPGFSARCDTQMAAAYLELGQLDEAQERLEEALVNCQEQGMALGADLCEILIADVEHRSGKWDAAVKRYSDVGKRLNQAGMAVDAAVCTIALGELALERGEPRVAQAEFESVLPLLAAGFPDHAWRAAYGLGQSFHRQGDPMSALSFYQQATEFVRRARATIWAEEISGRFFNHRRHPFSAGIGLALELGDTAAALEMTEKSKGQTFLSLLRTYEASLHLDPQTDPHIRELLEQEEATRRLIVQIRGNVALTTTEGMRKASMPDVLSDDESVAELARLEHQHSSAIAALRAHEVGLLDKNRLLPAFDPARFRQVAAKKLRGEQWACLAYYQEGDDLLIFYMDAETLQHWRRPLDRTPR